jgi:hypothetical protein
VQRAWSLYTVKGAGSDEEDDEVNAKNETIVDDDKVMGWAKVCLTYQVPRISPYGSCPYWT